MHLDVKIYGKVQGVGFRYAAWQKAEELGINGVARNTDDGAVYIEAEGEKSDLKKFLDWCYHGPDTAEVKKVGADFSRELANYNEFGLI